MEILRGVGKGTSGKQKGHSWTNDPPVEVTVNATR